VDLAEAVAALRRGGVIGFSTDTVYGLAVLPGGEAKVHQIKGRPADLPLILMVARFADLDALVAVDRRARWYMDRWWPGPLTLVLPAVAGGGTLGVRLPDHPLALELLRAAGPLFTTSANRHGEPPALTAAEAALVPGLAGVLDGGRAPGGEPSTVISLLPGQEMTVIREGAISSHLLGDDEHL
jgi:L-threonylcarbamoyladenylate synthase